MRDMPSFVITEWFDMHGCEDQWSPFKGRSGYFSILSFLYLFKLAWNSNMMDIGHQCSARASGVAITFGVKYGEDTSITG
eukprot:6401188-Ditylum_brightwellii.AAC.1